MMKLLVPLGLLGLIGIAVLILIYIIRPNYQTQHVSSTYVWRLSLNYKRKRPPVSKIRNILIFICQILILTAMALLMAWPAITERSLNDETDAVYILDSSASMYAGDGETTRFDRALSEIRTRADEIIASGGKATVIVADDAPYFLAQRVDSSRTMRFHADMDALKEKGCSYAVSDLEAALTLSREVLEANPAAAIYLFTDTEYSYVPERVTVELVRENTEWNAAILGASAERENGYYTITVQIACYGVTQELKVEINVDGANSIPASGIAGNPVEFYKYVDCGDDAVKTVIFRVGGGVEDENLFYYDVSDTQRFFSFNSIQVSIEADDSYPVDDHFSIYGGQKELLKVMYYSTDPNPFIQTALAIAHNALADRYDLEVYEVKKGDAPILEGYDFYVFEHGMPSRLPTDGAILLLDPNPNIAPVPLEADFVSERTSDFNGGSVSLAEGDDYEGHPITRYLIADDIEVSFYDLISDYDPSYQVLLTYDGNPMLMVRNEEEVKIAVMAFSVHYSNLAKLPENFLLMYSIIDYFFPSIISGNAFEVNQSFTLNTWGDELAFSSGEVFSAEQMPMKFSLDTPGDYRFTQTTYYGRDISVEVFIKPPAEESNIRKTEDSFSDPYEGMTRETVYRDLLIIFASILLGLVLLEWILQSRENK